MFMLDIKDYGWWYWLGSTVCLWLTVMSIPGAFACAVLLAVIQLVHFRLVEGCWMAFPVQVRLAYFLYLLIALPEGMQWILWLPAVGGFFRVVFGYCLLARVLSLLPFNRDTRLDWRLMKHVIFTPPVRGNILQGLPQVT